jgi:hypothetical protein
MPYKAKLTTRSLSTSTITTDDLAKGTELTFQQADSNFLNLRDQSIGIAADDSTTIDIGMGNTLKIAGSGTVTTAVSGQTLTITGSGGGGSANLGDLQVNGTTLSPINTNSDLTLIANGTGQVIIEDLIIDELPTDEGAQPAGLYLKAGTNQSKIGFRDNGELRLDASTSVVLAAGSTYDINLYSTAAVRAINSTKFVIGNSGINPSITSHSGTLTINTAEGTDSGSIVLTAGANGNISITPNGTGSIVLDGVNWPQADGTAGQVLSTNGTGQLSYISAGTGDLTITGSQILGPSNGDIDITPGGTGNVNLRTDTVRVGDSASSGLITNAAAGLSLQIGSDFGQTGAKTLYNDGGNIITTLATNQTMELRSSSTSDARLEISLQTTGTTIKTLTTMLGAGNKNLTLSPDGTGDLILDGLKWPQADGTANQVIKTNGSGQLSFTSINSIASTYVHHTITDPFDGSTNPTNLSVDFANGAMQTISLAGDTYDIQTPTNMTAGSILYLLFGSTRAGNSNVGFPSGYNAYGNGRFGVNQNQRVIWTIFYNGTDYIATTSANLST